ncbi:Ecdysteroid kinase-domain-containing protein [Aspergillus granulosus]|uniref:Ecdysteroid kinase-domain-containing protein n=1 Tax=Aspergillus granulosus TaxID=176169 RepID=A0ABR4HC10_9EURO
MADSKISIQRIEDVTLEFLAQALGQTVTSFITERIGTGQVGECHRISLSYAPNETGPATVIIKLGASGHLSRESGMKLGIYERESRFYSEVVPTLDSTALVKSYHTVFDRDRDFFHILLEDISPAAVGDEIEGATLDQARLALDALGKIQKAALFTTHPKWVGDSNPPSQVYLQQLWLGFLARYGSKVKPEHQQVVTRWLACFDTYAARIKGITKNKCLVHGDYRLDNMLFKYNGETPVSVSVVDWQMLNMGSVFQDLAYFIGMSIPTKLRRENINELLQVYYEAFGSNPPFTMEECLEGIREQIFWGLPLAFASPMILEQTDRGDEMFLTMLDRLATYIIDLNAVQTLPPISAPKPLTVDPKDEASHPITEHPLHNESIYFDVVNADQGIGIWLRLGVTPNQPGSWYNALICGPDRPTIAVSDFEVPTPGPDFIINTDKIKATHTPESPLDRYRVTLIGRGESFDDPADLLRGTKGMSVNVYIDLTWHTAGTPYQWSIATRYEIPCTVSGTILVDNTVTQFTAAPGQRDHSWGVRDWWSFDWVWTAFHLDDGTEIHGVQVRLPTGPVSVGYIQSPEIPIAELTGVEVVEQLGSDGLPKAAIIAYSSQAAEKVVLNVRPKGHGPIRLDGPDGKLALFPRLWAEVEAQDGRKGVGWIEWNLVQG